MPTTRIPTTHMPTTRMPTTHLLPSGMATIIRPVTPHDAPGILAAFQAHDDMQRQGTVSNMESARNYISSITADRNAAFVTEMDSTVAALVGINVDDENRSGWVFYWAHPDFRGRGTTTTLVQHACDWAFDDAGLERLELGYRVNNPASAAVARKAGFVKEGLERAKFLVNGERVDAVMCSRLKSDPPPAKR